jgi:hypothetical protein
MYSRIARQPFPMHFLVQHDDRLHDDAGAQQLPVLVARQFCRSTNTTGVERIRAGLQEDAEQRPSFAFGSPKV